MTDHRTPLTPLEALTLAEYDRDHHGGGLADMLEAVANGATDNVWFRPTSDADVQREESR